MIELSQFESGERTVLHNIESQEDVFIFPGWNTGEHFVRLSAHYIAMVTKCPTSGLWERTGEERHISDLLTEVQIIARDEIILARSASRAE